MNNQFLGVNAYLGWLVGHISLPKRKKERREGSFIGIAEVPFSRHLEKGMQTHGEWGAHIFLYKKNSNSTISEPWGTSLRLEASSEGASSMISGIKNGHWITSRNDSTRRGFENLFPQCISVQHVPIDEHLILKGWVTCEFLTLQWMAVYVLHFTCYLWVLNWENSVQHLQ